MFWFQEKNDADNTVMFYLLPSSAAQSQSCFSFLRFSYCPTSKGAAGGGHTELGGGRYRTADPNWPRGFSYHMTSCGKKV